MPCQATHHREELRPLTEDVDVHENDEDLNLQFLKKHFQVNTLDQTLQQRRKEFQTRSEHLQKRREALHQREIIFKERIISYEMYIKELAMKGERSLRRIEDEKVIRKNKQMEIDLLKREIEEIEEEKDRLDGIIQQYQPHLDLLTQIVDRTDRFHSIDEMIEKFDVLHASYQDILMTMNHSNEELNDLQRQLLLTIEKKNSRISLMNTRIHQVEQNLLNIQERIQKIQIEIQSHQHVLKDKLTENGAITIAIESMFDLVKRYSHRSRRKDLRGINHALFDKLQRIDVFLSDLVYYVDYVHNKQRKLKSSSRSIAIAQEMIPNKITEEMNDQSWRNSCDANRRAALIKDQQQPYFSYQVRGEDNTFYTIQLMNIDRKKSFHTRLSLTPHRSTVSMIVPNIEKKTSGFPTASTSKLPSYNTPARPSLTRSIRTEFRSSQTQNINEKIPFLDLK